MLLKPKPRSTNLTSTTVGCRRVVCSPLAKVTLDFSYPNTTLVVQHEKKDVCGSLQAAAAVVVAAQNRVHILIDVVRLTTKATL